jgi:protein phosphatase
VQTLLPAQDPLVVVCDGIGGHQGGDVASGLAIQAVEQQIKSLDLTSPDATTLMVELEKAICLANDQISRRNDSEQRYERQRMGTTLVMGLLRGHELYITHVGDSRAYWITRQGCHQVTLDDDVASREVRLGYCTYQQALQHPGSGSLVQALGMGESSMLYPAVQRFILAEDSVFLLCSDGLSDGDRVEENWEAEILPLLEGKTDIESLSKRLVEIANTQNGHDNVTVGLIYVQMESAPASAANLSTLPSLATQQPTAAVRLSPAAPGTTASTPASATAFPTQISNAAATTLSERTELMQPKQDTSRARFILFGLIALLGGVIGLLAYFLLSPRLGAPEATPSLSPSPVGVSPGTDSSSPPALLAIGSIVQVVPQSAPVTPSVNPSPTQSPNVNSTIDSTVNSTIVAPTLRLQRSLPTATPSPSLVVPSPEDDAIAVANGTLLRVMTHQERDRIRWVQLQVCQPLPETRSIPQDLTQNPVVTSPLTPDVTPDAAATPFNAPSVVPQTVGQVGWIQESTLQTQVVPATALTPEQRAACQNPRQSRLPGEG